MNKSHHLYASLHWSQRYTWKSCKNLHVGKCWRSYLRKHYSLATFSCLLNGFVSGDGQPKMLIFFRKFFAVLLSSNLLVSIDLCFSLFLIPPFSFLVVGSCLLCSGRSWKGKIGNGGMSRCCIYSLTLLRLCRTGYK
jgi:hypothetical protein